MTFQAPKEGYLFVITYGRSGSTLLQNILLSINGYCIRGENRNVLQSAFRSYFRAKHAKDVYGRRPKTIQRPWYGADLINPDGYASRLKEAFVEEILAPPANARVVGFKEIRWQENIGEEDFFSFLEFLQSFFSPCRFIFNSRNAEAVADSKWMQDNDRDETIQNIKEYDNWYRAYTADNPHHSFHLYYDDYKSDVNALKPLFDFLGESFEQEKLQQIMDVKLDH